ncbi:MAG TPA: hypothetical protein VNH18_06330, partial [Bryobacteraceae bacterium]|nr:hypothetical protein [Bryobacteraceae bacterium]
MGAHRTFQRLLELAATIAAFGSVYGVYRVSFDQSLPAGPTAAGCVASGLAFWLSSQLKERAPDDNNTWVIFVEQFCFGTGVSLLVHALLTYALLWRRTPFLVVGSSLAAAVLITLLRHMESNRFQQAPRILLAGFDKLSATLIAEVKKPVTGICGTCTVPPPPGVPILGATSDFERIVQETAPTHILISVEAWEKTISPEVLLHCRMNGIRITESAALYEKLLSRVCCERLQPVDLMLSSFLRGDSRTMAIQAVYNNLAGLSFLLLLAPVMLLISAVSALTSGRGPIIESIECA